MHKFFFALILLLASVLRLVKLDTFPPALNWDEVSLGYNAYSLLLTGADEWGVSFPTIFRAFGDYKLPTYVYATTPIIKLLGPTDLAVRLPSALAGILTVAVAYVLGHRLFGRQAGLITALLVALEPWTLFLSHLALEANLAVLLLALGLALLVSRKFPSALLFLSLSAWTYNSTRLFVPLFLLSYVLLKHRYLLSFFRPRKLRLGFCLVVLAVFWLPLFVQLLSPGAQSRLRWLTILDSGAIATIENFRLQSTFPPPLTRLLYNRPVYFASTALTNYLSYLSPKFLFVSGGDHYQFNVQGHGLLYLVNLPLFYLGILLLLTSKTLKHKSLIILWLLLAPIPGSLVRDAPHTLRAITFVPLPMFLSAYALDRLGRKFRRLFPLYVLVVLLSCGYYLSVALTNYARSYSSSFQYGHRQLVDYLKLHFDEYDDILVTKKYGEPHAFMLFYWPWNPDFYRSDPHLVRYGRSDWFWVDSFSKFRFINDWDMPGVVAALDPDRKVLIVASPDNPPPATDLAVINFLDGSPAFLLKEK